jgi:hypothetical protein
MEKKKRKIYRTVASLGALGLSAVAATGTNALAAGRIIITPHIETSIEYNSNFFRTEHDAASVTAWNIAPGVQVIYKTAKTKVTLDGTLERHEYFGSDNAVYGKIDDYSFTGGKASGEITSQVTDRLTVGLKDDLRVTRDPEYVDEYSQETGFSQYTTNSFTPNIYYDFGNKFGIGARYQNSLITWNESNNGTNEDYTENRGAIDAFYNLNRSTAIYLEYQIWKGDYDGYSSDYLANQITLNASKQFNYFTLTAGAGYYSRSFDQSGLDNLDGIAWKIMLDGHDRSEAEDSKPRSFVRLALLHDLNNYGAGDSYYAATRLELKGGYLFRQKLEVSGMAMYQNEDYQMNPSDRTDNLYVLSARVGYEVRDKLTLSVEGGYRDRDSNATGQSYNDTFIMAKLEYAYSFGHE